MLTRALAMMGFGRRATPRRRMSAPIVRARYDAAQTTPDNRRHWAAADSLDPNAAVSPEVRRLLRARARYEVANNSYAKGILLTLANDLVGTGPRLQMLTDDRKANALIEDLFDDWARRVDLAGKLRTMRMARAESGEVFAVLTTNEALGSPVQLDVRLIEADQVASPYGVQDDDDVDGIVFDKWGNPAAYRVLRRHPGATGWSAVATPLESDLIPASVVMHYFRPDRPGQCRGVPDITPALPLFAQLRRYTLAVIAAAETAADFAAVIYSDSPAIADDGEDDPDPMDLVELEKRMATVLPAGWKLGQLQAQQPTTTYGDFKAEILNEIARCLNMPFNVAAGNSSGYNYASGRLDHQTYYKSIRVEQHHMKVSVLDRILAAWIDEAVLVEGLLPQSLRSIGAAAPHTWFWDGVEHVDPAKEANAQATRLANNTTTLAHECARQGLDWEDVLRQRAAELKVMRRLGVPYAQQNPGETPDDTDKEPDDEAEEQDARAALASR